MSNKKVNLNLFKNMVLLFSLLTVLVTSFQNCSNWNGSVAVLSKPLDDSSVNTLPVEYVPPPKSDKTSKFYEVEMGNRTNFPDLKMFFIVDNSYTMKQAHENLAASFEKMYLGNSSQNLTPFNTSIYLFSTAQYNSNSISASLKAKLPSKNASAINNSRDNNFINLSIDRDLNLSGNLAGDIIGYSTHNKLNSDLREVGFSKFIEYQPAPVMSFDIEPNTGRNIASNEIKKEKNEQAQDVVAAFKDKLSVLSPTRSLGKNFKITSSTINNVVIKTIEGEFNEVLDHESGLCAISRVLRNNTDYLKAGDLASFILVTDEDDYDPYGQNCIQLESTQELSPSESGWYQKAKCVSTNNYYQGNLRYQVTQTPSCIINYKTGYTASITGREAKTKVKYSTESYKKNATYWKSTTANPVYETKLVFSKSSQECYSNDGIPSCKDPVITTATSIVPGDYSAPPECKNKALLLGAIIDDTKLVTCSRNQIGGGTTYNQITDEAFDSSLDCLFYVSGKGGLTNDANHPYSCSTNIYTVFNDENYTTEISGSRATLCPPNDPTKTNNFINNQLAAITHSTAVGHTPTCVDGANNNTDVTLASTSVTYSNSTNTLPLLDPSVYPTAGTYSISSTDTKLSSIIGNFNISNSAYSNLKLSIIHQESTTGPINLSQNEVCNSSYATNKCNTISGCKFPVNSSPTTSYSTPITLVTTGTSKDMNCNLLCSDVKKVVNGEQSSYCSPGSEGMLLKEFINNNINSAIDGSCEFISNTLQTKSYDLNTFGGDAGIEMPQADYLSYQCSSGTKLPVGNAYQRTITSATIQNTIEAVNGEKLSVNKKIPDQPLFSYIDQKSQELMGSGNKPLFTLFTPKSMDINKSNYGQLINLSKGQVADLNSGDYSPALDKLSEVIKERLNRSIQIENLEDGEQVLHIWRQTPDNQWGEEIKSENWTQNGKTILFNESLKIELTDKFKIEYK